MRKSAFHYITGYFPDAVKINTFLLFLVVRSGSFEY